MRGMLTARISEFLNTNPEPDDVAPPKHIVQQGQPHMLAYITPSEAGLLRDVGGGVAPDGGQSMMEGIPSFQNPDDPDDPGGLTGDWGKDPGREAAASSAATEASEASDAQGLAVTAMYSADKLAGVHVNPALGPMIYDQDKAKSWSLNEQGEPVLTAWGKGQLGKSIPEGGVGRWSMANTADVGMTASEVAMLGLENTRTGESILNETTDSQLGVQASHVYAKTKAGQRMGMFQTGLGILAGGPVGAIGTLAGVLEGSPITSGILGALPGTQTLQDLTGQGLLDKMGWRSAEDKYGFAAPGAFDGGALEGLVDPVDAGGFMGAASGADPGPDLVWQPPEEETLPEDDLAVVDPAAPDEVAVDPTTLATIPTDVVPVDLAGTYQPFTPSFGGATPVLTRELAAMFVPPGLQFGPLTLAEGGPAVKKRTRG